MDVVVLRLLVATEWLIRPFSSEGTTLRDWLLTCGLIGDLSDVIVITPNDPEIDHVIFFRVTWCSNILMCVSLFMKQLLIVL